MIIYDKNTRVSYSEMEQLENKLLKAILHGRKDDSFFKEFFQSIPSVYPKEIIVRNFTKIANLIWRNHWEKGTWNAEDIYSRDFKEICRTPIYLPALGMELLSGEYVMFLLHRDSLKLKYRVQSAEPTESGTDEKQLKEYRQISDRRKHERFFGSKNSKTKSYMEQFSEILSINLENNLSTTNSINERQKRKGTEIYSMFDEYAYAAYDINKDVGESIDVLGIFNAPYVYNIDVFEIMNDTFLPVHCEGLLLFKTALFQHLDRHQRMCMMRFASQIQELVEMIPAVVSSWRRCVAVLSGRRKQSKWETGKKYKKLMEMSKKWMVNEIDAIHNELGSNTKVANKSQQWSCYPDVLWKLLVVEADATSKISRTSTIANVEETKETERLHLFIALEPTKAMGTSKWEDFLQIYGEAFKEYFDEQDESRLKADWLLALKTILYCNHDFLKMRRDAAIPKKMDAEWIQKNNISIQNLPIGGILTAMQFVRHAPEQKVRLKESSVRMHDGTLAKRKIFFSLLPNDAAEESITMRKALESLSFEKFSPVLAVQIREILREYKAAVRLDQNSIQASRRMLLSLWSIFDKRVRHASTFDETWKNVSLFLRRLHAINNIITAGRIDLDFHSF